MPKAFHHNWIVEKDKIGLGVRFYKFLIGNSGFDFKSTIALEL